MTRDDVIKAMAEAIGGPNCLDKHAASLALKAIEALGVRLVPVEPTEEMLQAAWDYTDVLNSSLTWTYMLLASPLNSNDMCQANTVQGCGSSSETSSPLHSVAQWMPIETVPANRVVLVSLLAYGRPITVKAKFIPAKTEEASMESCHSEYDEDTDTYYCPEGWYEDVHAETGLDYGYIQFDGKPTHWMSLPAPPLHPYEERSDDEQPQGKTLA